MERSFSELDENALAAASIGQVHRAVTKDGTSVVIKVQRPHIKERIKVDLKSSLFSQVDGGALRRVENP